jgi:hypothetical protein
MKFDDLSREAQSTALEHVQWAITSANLDEDFGDDHEIVWDDLLSPQNIRREARELFEFNENGTVNRTL